MRYVLFLGCFTLLFWLAPDVLFAQQIPAKPKETIATDQSLSKFTAEVSIVHLIDPSFPSAQLTLGYRVGEHNYLGLGYGHLLGFFLRDYPGAIVDQSGYRLRLGFQRFFKFNNDPGRSFYWGINADYRNIELTQAAQFILEPTLQQTFTLAYTSFQDNYTLASRVGAVVRGDLFYLDMGVGFGFRYSEQSNSSLPGGVRHVTDSSFLGNPIQDRWRFSRFPRERFIPIVQWKFAVGVHL